MQLAEILLLLMWVFAGLFITYGCITNNPKYRVQNLFSIESRFGQLGFGIVLLAFVIMRVYQWQTSANPNIIWSF